MCNGKVWSFMCIFLLKEVIKSIGDVLQVTTQNKLQAMEDKPAA